MSGGKKALLVVGLSLAIVILGWVALLGAVYAWGGVMTVRVHDPGEGVNLYLPVPAALIEVAVAGSQSLIPDEELASIGVDLGELQPLVEEMLRTLDAQPDFTLVEVEDHDEHVRVYKEGGALKVEVDGDVTVRVSIPTRAVRRTVARLSRTI